MDADDSNDIVETIDPDEVPSSGSFAAPLEYGSVPRDAAERGSAWTLPLLCLGIGLIACCVLIPQVDENRRLAYERERLKRDLEQIEKQVAVNDEFLHRLAGDANLIERLAQRQMKLVRAGTRELALRDDSTGHGLSSPYTMINVPAPVPLRAYRSIGGSFAEICRQPRGQLYLSGLGLMLTAAGLVLGGESLTRPPDEPADELAEDAADESAEIA